MNGWRWIDDSVVRAVHESQLAEHGGSLGVRDAGLLASGVLSESAYADWLRAGGVELNTP